MHTRGSRPKTQPGELRPGKHRIVPDLFPVTAMLAGSPCVIFSAQAEKTTPTTVTRQEGNSEAAREGETGPGSSLTLYLHGSGFIAASRRCQCNPLKGTASWNHVPDNTHQRNVTQGTLSCTLKNEQTWFTEQSECSGGQIREEHTHDSRVGVGWFAGFAKPTGVYAPGPGAVLDTVNRSR